jgi:hypothetical protein
MTKIIVEIQQMPDGRMSWTVQSCKSSDSPKPEQAVTEIMHEFLDGYLEGFLQSLPVIHDVKLRVARMKGK